jgi:hypothetical protein
MYKKWECAFFVLFVTEWMKKKKLLLCVSPFSSGADACGMEKRKKDERKWDGYVTVSQTQRTTTGKIWLLRTPLLLDGRWMAGIRPSPLQR